MRDECTISDLSWSGCSGCAGGCRLVGRAWRRNLAGLCRSGNRTVSINHTVKSSEASSRVSAGGGSRHSVARGAADGTCDSASPTGRRVTAADSGVSGAPTTGGAGDAASGGNNGASACGDNSGESAGNDRRAAQGTLYGSFDDRAGAGHDNGTEPSQLGGPHDLGTEPSKLGARHGLGSTGHHERASNDGS